MEIKPKKRNSQYKPLLFTTTMRNPERIKLFLNVLKDYNGEVLTDELAEKIVGDIIKYGLYKPTNLSHIVKEKLKSKDILSNKEVQEVLSDNPQDHKEAGFKKGWSSRFDTHFRFAKELGFVFYNINEKIEFSEVGLKLIDIEHPEYEQQIFLNAFAKYQSNNPFRRVLNENAPFILLLRVIKKINNDNNFNHNGISRLELPIVICWRDNDAEALYLKIKDLRENYGYNPSSEVVLKICDELTYGRHNKQKDKTIMKELPDEFIRKVRMTGLITIRGAGYFIDINEKERDIVDYVIDNYMTYKKFSNEKEYFNYISQIDSFLIKSEIVYVPDLVEEKKHLTKWAQNYSWEKVKLELKNFTKSNYTSKDEILKFIPEPLRLEFLTSLAIIIKFPELRIIPNYITDDEGLPSSFAPGNKSDIECYEGEKCTLVEVTLINGSSQVRIEMISITRHLIDKKRSVSNSTVYFIAPNIHGDTKRYTDWLKHKDDLDIFNFSINEFVDKLDNNLLSEFHALR